MIKGLGHFGHIALRVKDMEASLDFYCTKLGLPEVHRLYRDNGDLWLVYVRITDDQFLELFPAGEGDAPPRSQTGVNHICLTVDDVDAVAAQLREAGVELTAEPSDGADGNRGAWIVDPDGNHFELMQMRPDSIQYQAIRRWHEQHGASAK